jgi:hypothetical protein
VVVTDDHTWHDGFDSEIKHVAGDGNPMTRAPNRPWLLLTKLFFRA